MSVSAPFALRRVVCALGRTHPQSAVLNTARPSGQTFATPLRSNHTSSTLRDLRTRSEPVIAEQDVMTETQSVADLDGLLRTVRSQVDSSHYRSIPMRARSPFSPLSPSTSSTPPATAAGKKLEPRRMHDSYSEVTLPFSSNPALWQDYINPSGGLRTGKLMEHLDALAGSISYRHVLGSPSDSEARMDTSPEKNGLYIVTAACDRLDMLDVPLPGRDVRMSGMVIAVGRSSMEVVVRMENLGGEGEQDRTLLLGRFSMVCRDAFTHKARDINPLQIETAEDKALNAIGESHRTKRQSLALRSLSRVPPTQAEAEMLHKLHLEYGKVRLDETMLQHGEERVWMGDTKLEVSQVMFPQDRNIHGKVFGGYLMRLAYELSYANASLFTRQTVRFLSLDKIAFAKPVPIGSILRLTSHVLHTTSTARFPVLVHIGVRADVVDVKTGAASTTNDFRFTWGQEDVEPLSRMVVPRTYQGSMLWLEGKRALELNTILGRRRE